jgi:transposase
VANRDTIVKRMVSAVNQINRWVDIVFPELRQVFQNVTCISSLATLRLFPLPTEVKTMQAADIIEGWKSYVKRLAGLRKAQLLIDLAKRSVGPKQALQAYKLHLQQLLEEYDLAQTQLQQVELEIKSVLNRIPYAKKLLAIKGMSTISIAGILGESGDLSGFAHGNSLLRHAGLNLSEASSGKWKGQITLSKRGRPRLRRFIFITTMSLVMNNPDFREMQHHHNVHHKKLKKMKSIMKLCGKLARILVGMARSGESYNSHRTLPLTA